MDIAAEDLSPDAGVQYAALYMLERANEKGLVQGHIPRRLLTNGERELSLRLFRDTSGLHAYSDIQLEGALRYAILHLVDQGYQFECSVDKIMEWFRGSN